MVRSSDSQGNSKFRNLEWIALILCGVSAGIFAMYSMMGWVSGPDIIPVYGDMEDYFVPLWYSFREALLSGRFPWWHELQDLGFPLASNPQASPFHLPNYLLLFPASAGIRLHLATTAFVHATGVYLLMRRKYSLSSAFVIAVGTSISGFLLALHSMATVLWTFAWIPWVVWGILALGRSRFAAWILGIALAQSFLAGAWDVWIGIIPLVLAFHYRHLLMNLRNAFGAGLFSLAMVLPQVVLTIPYLDRTQRKSEGILRSFHWSAGWHDVLGYFSPNAMLSAFGTRAWELVLGDRVGWVLVAWPGLLCLTLLPIFFWFLYSRKRFFLAILLIQVGIASAGSIPGVKEFCVAYGLQVPVRYPDKLLLGALWMQIFVTWFMLPGWLRWMRKFDTARIVAISSVWISSWPLLGVLSRDRVLQMHIPLMWKEQFDYVAAVDLYLMVSNRDLFWVTGSAVVLLALVVAYRWRPKMILLVLSLTAISDPLLASTSIGQGRPLRDPSAWVQSARVNLFPPGRVWREPTEPKFIFNKPLPESLGCDTLTGRLVAEFYSALEIGSEDGWTWVHGFNVLAPFYSRTLSRLSYVHPPYVTREGLYRVSTKYVIGHMSALVQYDGLFDSCIVDNSPIGICRLKDARAKFNIVNRAIYYPTDSSLVQNMIDLTPDREAIYLKRPGEPIRSENVAGQRPRILQIKDSLSDERRLLLEPVKNPAWMTMATSWDPGWSAWVDGQQVDVFRADYAICGIVLPAGAREVIFKYRPKGLLPSLIGSLLIFVFSLLVITWGQLRPFFDQVTMRLLLLTPKRL